MGENKKSILDQLQALESLSNDMDGFTDPLAQVDVEKFMADYGMAGEMPDMSDMGIFGASPFAGMTMSGAAKEVGLFDTIIVHGLRGEYKLTFEETDEGLVINMVK